MPESTAPFHPGNSSPGLIVEVSKFPYDWDSSRDLEDVTGERFSLLGDLILRGAWFLNPIRVVHALTASETFFRAARRARSQWLRTTRQVMSNHGQHHRAGEAERRGRRAAYLDILSANPEEGRLPDSDEPFPLSDLSRDQRAEVLSSGKLAKQMAFSGLMIIDGNLVLPRTWEAKADQVLNPNRRTITVVRRRIDLTCLKATNDLEPLKHLSRDALQAQLDHHPNDVAFVTPQVTISAPSATAEFYAKADQFKGTWCILLKRTLGCGNVRRLSRASDQETRCLVLFGTLIEDGQVYLPGFWPNQVPKPSDLKRTPYQSSVVPLTFLGLHPSNQMNATEPSNPDSGRNAVKREVGKPSSRTQGSGSSGPKCTLNHQDAGP